MGLLFSVWRIKRIREASESRVLSRPFYLLEQRLLQRQLDTLECFSKCLKVEVGQPGPLCHPLFMSPSCPCFCSFPSGHFSHLPFSCHILFSFTGCVPCYSLMPDFSSLITSAKCARQGVTCVFAAIGPAPSLP